MLLKRFYTNYSNLDVPILDLGDQMGDTCYIDFINSKMMSHYIMHGKDKYNRPFLSIKVQRKFKPILTTIDGEKQLSEKWKIQDIVGTFFQRYSDGDFPIVFGTCYPSSIIYHSSKADNLFETNVAFGRIKKLLAGESIRSIDIWKNDIKSKLDIEELEELYINGNSDSFVYIPEIRNKIKKQLLEINFLYNDITGLIMEYF